MPVTVEPLAQRGCDDGVDNLGKVDQTLVDEPVVFNTHYINTSNNVDMSPETSPTDDRIEEVMGENQKSSTLSSQLDTAGKNIMTLLMLNYEQSYFSAVLFVIKVFLRRAIFIYPKFRRS